jgi:hypothetical protein
MGHITTTGLATLLLVALACLLAVSAALAATGDEYDLSWWTVDGGGTTCNLGGGYALGSTAGQPDAGVLGDGGYTLTGGFWGGAMLRYSVYLPLVARTASTR